MRSKFLAAAGRVAARYGKIAGVLAMGLVLGAFGMRVVSASIPDSSGSIHGCRNSLTTMLRVIDDSSQSCGSDETALNWDQDGVKGYARIVFNGGTGTYSLDSAHSKNISNFFSSTSHGVISHWPICLTLSTVPNGMTVEGDTTVVYDVKDAGGNWADGAGGPGSICDVDTTGANVAMQLNSPVGSWFSAMFY
jgi:hypothetical protein